jgi:hypothetical protein
MDFSKRINKNKGNLMRKRQRSQRPLAFFVMKFITLVQNGIVMHKPERFFQPVGFFVVLLYEIFNAQISKVLLRKP